MVAFRKPHYFTREEYLERELHAEMRYEYYDGEIVAMAGATPDHDRIADNIFGRLFIQLDGKDCQPSSGNVRVWVPECNRYYYPDASVTCGEPEYERIGGVASLLNPTLVVEVLSKTTEHIDRREKLRCYRTLESLRVYVLMAQDRPRAEIWRRDDGEWLYGEVEGLDAMIPLEDIGCALRMADVYARVTFPSPEEDDRGKGGVYSF